MRWLCWQQSCIVKIPTHWPTSTTTKLLIVFFYDSVLTCEHGINTDTKQTQHFVYISWVEYGACWGSSEPIVLGFFLTQYTVHHCDFQGSGRGVSMTHQQPACCTLYIGALKPQSHQAYDRVTTYLRPKNGPIVERTYNWSQRSCDWSQRSWVIARGKSVATRSMVMFETGRATLRPVVPPIGCSLTK